MTTATRERILTDNERYGGTHLDEEAGGAWIVIYDGDTAIMEHVANVFSNRQVCEDYIYAKCDEHPGRNPDDYSIQVWAISDTWPPEEEA